MNASMTRAFNSIKSTLSSAGEFGIGAYGLAKPGIASGLRSAKSTMGYEAGVLGSHLKTGYGQFMSGVAGGAGVGSSLMGATRGFGRNMMGTYGRQGAMARGAGAAGLAGAGTAWGLGD